MIGRNVMDAGDGERADGEGAMQEGLMERGDGREMTMTGRGISG